MAIYFLRPCLDVFIKISKIDNQYHDFKNRDTTFNKLEI